MRFAVCLLAFVLYAVPVAAQHPCAKPQLSGNNTVTAPTFAFVACHQEAQQADGIAIELNGTVTFTTKVPDGPPDAAGKVPFNVSVTLSGRGNHTVRTAAFTLTSTGSRQVGPWSGPFVLNYEKPVPTSAPTNHGL